METAKDRPVLMNTVSVGGILDYRKTQTRRVVKPHPDYAILKKGVELEAHKCPVLGPVHLGRKEWGLYGKPYQPNAVPCFAYNCPYGMIGDRLWVRETWANLPELSPEKTLVYKATDRKGWLEYETETIKWKPSIFMFRKYSRILLEITHLKIERIQDISEEDAIAEGIEKVNTHIGLNFKLYGPLEKLDQWTKDPRWSFETLWPRVRTLMPRPQENPRRLQPHAGIPAW